MSSITVIIPAAGSGTRLDHDIPKPYIELGGAAILEHTVRRFIKVDGLSDLIVATSGRYRPAAEDILKSILPPKVAGRSVTGGRERQQSVYNALQVAVDGDSELIIIHDAVRPFVTLEKIEACCRAASESGAAVLGVPSRDTIKRIDRNRRVRETPSRSVLWQAQTPQVFRKEILLEAYHRAQEEEYQGTDDASLVERLGYDVQMIEGDHTNFKITYPLDLRLARLLIENHNPDS